MTDTTLPKPSIKPLPSPTPAVGLSDGAVPVLPTPPTQSVAPALSSVGAPSTPPITSSSLPTPPTFPTTSVSVPSPVKTATSAPITPLVSATTSPVATPPPPLSSHPPVVPVAVPPPVAAPVSSPAPPRPPIAATTTPPAPLASGTGSVSTAPIPPRAIPPTSVPNAPTAHPLPVGAPPVSPKPTGFLPPQSPTGTVPKKSIFRFLPLLLIPIIIISAIGGGLYYFLNMNSSGGDTPLPSQQPSTTQKEITYWGLWEPTTVMSEVLADFEQQHSGVKVSYVQQSYKEYRERLQTSIAEGKGPDVFRYHASWVPMLQSELSALPEKVMQPAEFSATFYPVVTKQLVLNGKIVGIPLMYDGLGLYYNKDVFTVANMSPPKDWEELKTTATALTVKSGTTVNRAGIALGTTNNVEHFSDILGLMLLQNGADPTDPTAQEAQDAMNFYTSFATKLKIWDSTLPSSTTAFARGDVAMMIAPSWRAHEIQTLNPSLQFAIAPVPQLPGTDTVTWASYWAEGVSTKSREKELGWELLKYLSSAPVQKKLYSAASKERAFGEIYSRVDLASELAADPYLGAYVQDAQSAKNWYLNAYTHDNGLNDRIIKYYLDAVNAIVGGAPLASTLTTIQQGVAQVLQQYGFAVSVPVSGAATAGQTNSTVGR